MDRNYRGEISNIKILDSKYDDELSEGILPEGTKVLVKKIKTNSYDELVLLMVSARNLRGEIKPNCADLLGYYEEEQNKIVLVYKYYPLANLNVYSSRSSEPIDTISLHSISNSLINFFAGKETDPEFPKYPRVINPNSFFLENENNQLALKYCDLFLPYRGDINGNHLYVVSRFFCPDLKEQILLRLQSASDVQFNPAKNGVYGLGMTLFYQSEIKHNSSLLKNFDLLYESHSLIYRCISDLLIQPQLTFEGVRLQRQKRGYIVQKIQEILKSTRDIMRVIDELNSPLIPGTREKANKKLKKIKKLYKNTISYIRTGKKEEYPEIDHIMSIESYEEFKFDVDTKLQPPKLHRKELNTGIAFRVERNFITDSILTSIRPI